MNDDQPTQPLTGYELDNIEGRWSRYVALRDPDSMETSVHDVPDLLAEVDRLRVENEQMRRNVAYAAAIVSGDAAEMLPETIAKLRAERNQLKEINDRMAEDRLRLVDERDSILADLLHYSHLHWENCPFDEEDCYLCEGYERIRASAEDRKHGKAPNQ